MESTTNAYPALHNAMWPGLVGKGPDSEPPIDLDTMLDLTAAAEVDGVRFDGVDLFLFAAPYRHRFLRRRPGAAGRQDRRQGSARRLAGGAGVAAHRRRLGHGQTTRSAAAFSTQVRKACRIGRKLRELGVRQYGDRPHRFRGQSRGMGQGSRRRTPGASPQTFREACAIAEDFGERLAAEGEICWGGMHSWRRNVELLEMVGRPQTLGFQADMAHTLLFTLGYNAPEDRAAAGGLRLVAIGPAGRGLSQDGRGAAALDHRFPRGAERRHGEGLGLARQDRPPLPAAATPTASSISCATRAPGCATTTASPPAPSQHICWDGCMFPNAVMLDPETWNDILRVMIAVRNAHGWN